MYQKVGNCKLCSDPIGGMRKHFEKLKPLRASAASLSKDTRYLAATKLRYNTEFNLEDLWTEPRERE